MTETSSDSAQQTTPPVFVIEDHDEAYYAWKRLGIQGATLIHIDAHIDLAWFNPASPRDILAARSGKELDALLRSVPVWNPSPDEKARRPTIGNYICSAIREGIVEKVYWVVPDDFLDTPRKVRYWKKMVEGVVRAVPGQRAAVIVEKKILRTRFLDRELIVCDLGDLPALFSNILLDIDTDFLVTRHDAAQYKELMYLKKFLPWLWPVELADILRRKKVDFSIATIAYSVEGHFTPIEYKFLGDWLKLILEGEGADNALVRAFGCLKDAVSRRYDGRLDGELDALRRAEEFAPGYASIHFILSRAHYDAGRIAEAQGAYRRAISLDGSYGTRYNNAGEIFHGMGMFDRMEREYERILALDADNNAVQMSRGEGFLARQKYREAEKVFEKAIAIDPRSVRARYLLANVRYAQQRHDDARVLLGEIVRDDPAHFGARALLGTIALKRRQYKEALENHRALLRFGYCDPHFYATLSMLFLLNRNSAKSLTYLWRSIALRPAAVKARLESLRQRALFKRTVARYAR